MSNWRLRNLFINISLSLGVLMIALAVGFLAIELHDGIDLSKNRGWHDPNTQFDSELGWSPIPSRHLNNSWGDITTNSMGFRSDEIDPNKDQIAILGDSVALGYQVGDHGHVGYYLDQLAKQDGMQVHNLGVSGYGIDQSYLNLKRHLKDFGHLKTVILIIFTENDLNDTRSNGASAKRKPLFILEEGKLKLTGTPIRKFCLRNLITKSFVLRRITSNPKLGPLLNPLIGDRILEESKAIEVVKLLLHEMEHLAQSQGANFLIVLSPHVTNFNEKSKAHHQFEQLISEEHFASINFFDAIKEEINSHPDLKLEDIFIDSAHLTKTGNQLLAKNIFKTIHK